MFAGWALNGDEENLYDAGTEKGTDKADDNYILRFKAVYKEPEPCDVKYAVIIYGIKQDKLKDGKTAALTFGPAGNYRYDDKPVSCDSPNCIHNMTWKKIIKQANEDPTVFQQCLENGCTHSVDLNLSESLYNTGYYPYNLHHYDTLLKNDGAGKLGLSLKRKYLQWNSYDHNAGGWPASRIRTTLNGKENCIPDTDESVAGNDLLSESEALISAFPEELQKAIVAKAVKSDTQYDDKANSTVTTYDKLWLFSAKELFIPNGTNQNASFKEYIRPNEGEMYQRIEILSSYKNFWIYMTMTNEDGGAQPAWLRSPSDVSYGSPVKNDSYVVTASASVDKPTYDEGIAPGFCIGIA